MSTPPLFPTSSSLLDLVEPPPPTSEVEDLDEKIRRCAHVLRMSPKAPGMRNDARGFINRFALTRECARYHGHRGGEARVADAKENEQSKLAGRLTSHHLSRATLPDRLHRERYQQWAGGVGGLSELVVGGL